MTRKPGKWFYELSALEQSSATSLHFSLNLLSVAQLSLTMLDLNEPAVGLSLPGIGLVLSGLLLRIPESLFPTKRRAA